ncbi:hypothetical protein L1987_25523 [Smallanthus sonchifolius]|uniref:Uncharacterized protein n=1 Tax=Smallanthus sonchifolius TaxID=185202 RepID=A0ACB9IPX4_9ASTR|nr:hypothetical protein L1987_25523 [Smallanthus sonchifolius]
MSYGVNLERPHSLKQTEEVVLVQLNSSVSRCFDFQPLNLSITKKLRFDHHPLSRLASGTNSEVASLVTVMILCIQGAESLASWQANLLFEPIQFEGLDVIVRRGKYEEAKGIYDQMLPEIHAHFQLHGDHAKCRFTGHSLGGSL